MRLSAKLVVAAVVLAAVPCPAFAQWSDDPSVNTPVVTADGFQASQRIIHDGEGGYFFVWYDHRNADSTGGDIYAQHFDADGDPRWGTDGAVVCDADGLQRYPNVALDQAGGIIVSWVDDRGAESDLYAQRLDADGMPRWAVDGVPVIATDGDDACGWIVRDGSHGAIVMGRDGTVNRVDADGGLPWGAAEDPVMYDSSGSSSPKLMEDGAGGAILVWQQDGEIAVQRVDGDGTLLWNGGDPVLLTGGTDHWGRCPRLVSDGAGGAIVIWYELDTRNLSAQRVDHEGAARWTPGGVQVANVYLIGPSYGLASDGAGGAFVTWLDAADHHVYAQRVGAGGGFLWPSSFQLAGTGDWVGPSDCPRKTVEDGSGGFITVWPDAYNEVVAQRVNADGNALWTADGVVLSNATGLKGPPAIEGNGHGGAVATWHDGRNVDTSSWDIYMQGVDPDGALGSPGYVAPAPTTPVGGVTFALAGALALGPLIGLGLAVGALVLGRAAWTFRQRRV